MTRFNVGPMSGHELYVFFLLLFSSFRTRAVETRQTIGDVFEFFENVKFNGRIYQVLYRKTLRFHPETSASGLGKMVKEMIEFRSKIIKQQILIRTPEKPKRDEKNREYKQASRELFDSNE